MKKLLLVAFAAAGVSAAHAQITPFTVEASYFRGNNFTTNAGTTSHLEGLQLGVSQSLLRLPFVGEARIGVTAMFGNVLSSGGVDGNIYGIHAMYKTPGALTGGLYGLIGVGYWHATGRGGSFDAVGGLGLEAGIGIPFSTQVPGVPSPAIEVRYRQGSHAQTRGFMVGIAVQF